MPETGQERLILIRDGVATELTGNGNDGESLLEGVRTILTVGINNRLVAVNSFNLTSQPAQEELRVPKVDLRRQTYELLSNHTFREPTAQEKKRLATMGYDIFLSTEAKPLSVVVTENMGHFWSGELDYVNARPNLRDYTPPALTIALRSGKLFLLDSFDRSQSVQLEMLEAESQNVQGQLANARIIMLPASTEAQLDLAYLKETGRVLFRDRFARALDEISGFFVADVGRDGPAYQLSVRDWFADDGHGHIGALSAVVFINSK